MNTDITCFEACGNKFEFIAMEKPDLMRVRQHWKDGNQNCTKLWLLDVHKVDIDTLKSHHIWDELSPEVQNSLENMPEEEKSKLDGHMERMRAARKSKYANMPKELVCKCGAKIAVIPSVLVARVDALNKKSGNIISVEDYVKSYQCQECHPTKGRRANPDNANLPKVMTCSCGKSVATNPYYLKSKAEKLGTTILELIKNFKCQTCVPTKRGRQKK